MDSDLQNLPEAQRLDYAPAPPGKRFPWMLLLASPFLAIGAGCLTGGLLSSARANGNTVVFAACGVGFLVLGAMLVLVHLRWR